MIIQLPCQSDDDFVLFSVLEKVPRFHNGLGHDFRTVCPNHTCQLPGNKGSDANVMQGLSQDLSSLSFRQVVT